MSKPFGRLRRFLRELKRRKVYRVAAGYLVAAFVVLQVAGLAADAFGFPGWFQPMIWVVAGLGFPLAIVLAWAFEVTPEGVRRTPETETEEAPETEEGQQGTRRAVQLLAALGLIAVAGAGIWQFTPLGDGDGGTEAATPRIAVLPFENISRDTDDAGFAQGMHEEVLTQLSKVSGLNVISRTSVMGYANTDKRVPEISNELGGVNAVLEGTVRRAAGRVRISTTLIKAPEDEDLWSNTYERQLSPEAIFDIQANIAEQIAGALETQLTGDERRRIEDVPTDDLAAYDAYLQGRNHFLTWLGRREPSLLNRAIDRLRDVVGRDSTFAEAYAWLGHAYVRRAISSQNFRWVDSARTAIDRAQTLDPDLAEGYVAEAFTYPPWDKQRIPVLRRALELQPSHALARAQLAEALHRQNRYVEAIRVAREAVQLDPRRPYVLEEMSDALRVVGFFEAAEAWESRVLEIEPGNVPAIDGLALNHLQRGRPDEAVQTWENFLKGTNAPPPVALLRAAEAALAAGRPEQAKTYLGRVPAALQRRAPGQTESEPQSLDVWGRRLLGLAELRLGNRERGRELLQQAADSLRSSLAEDEEEGPTTPINLAEALAALGQTEEALTLLEKSASVFPTESELLLRSPFFDDLRSDPRFQKIAREVEARRAKIREEVHQLGIDLYPPGAELNTISEQAQGRRLTRSPAGRLAVEAAASEVRLARPEEGRNMDGETASGLSRRRFLEKMGLGAGALGASLYLPGVVPARRGPLEGKAREPQEVLVLGAGLSGLAAAWELDGAGHEVTVLEARSRAGGRVHTLRSPFAGDLYAEAGGSVFGTNYTEANRYIDELGLERAQLDFPELRSLYHLEGTRFSVGAEETADWPYDLTPDEQGLRPIELLQRYVLDPLPSEITDPGAWREPSLAALDDLTLADYMRKQGASEGAVELIRHTQYFGSGMDEVSVLSSAMRFGLVFSAEGGFVLAGGNDRLPVAMAGRLSRTIRYGVEVTGVRETDTAVEVSAKRRDRGETYRADRVVCTLPATVLRNVRFEPPLPADKRDAVDELPYGAETRAFLQVDRAFWYDEGVSGSASTDLPIQQVNWHPSPNPAGAQERAVLASHTGGASARYFASWSRAKVIDRVLMDMEKVHPGIREHVEGTAMKAWSRDPYALGVSSRPAPGDVTAHLEALQQSHGRIHFAGEHTSVLRGTMEGALRSGIRAAEEVNEAAGG